MSATPEGRTKEIALELFHAGRAHALSADLLFDAAIDAGRKREEPDPELFAFNGVYSLSVHYLLGLGLELMLKAAIVAWGGPSDDKALKAIGHDLIKAHDMALRHGFSSRAPNLRAILEVMRAPYRAHYFRYGFPPDFMLPGDFAQVVANLDILDCELRAVLWDDEAA